MCDHQAGDERCARSTNKAMSHVAECRSRRKGKRASRRIRARECARGQEALEVQRKRVHDGNDETAGKKYVARPTELRCKEKYDASN